MQWQGEVCEVQLWPHDKCEVKNGVRACQAVGKGVCTISGDPHYNTFDNSTYDFQGTCTYTADQGCHLEGTHLKPFSVVVENEKWYGMSNHPNVSVAKLVAVEVYGNTMVLRKNQAGMIMVNGIMMSLPVTLNNGAVQAYQEGTYDVITTDFGLRVTYDLVYHLIVTVPGNYRDKTCGLCGNLNDNKNDEFQLPDGNITKDLMTFGAAWKISVPHVVCEDGCSGEFCQV
ncbi:IgGFc-binding protein-like [Coregonus clupeaformis]|uniref:IgGFc-binding protein-like n=1 Tax=Coregonus clupeaformis TaxID=59861 RepID=UPI001BE0552F|nr:IgGFc-binding protein-like [Coregonus clupeaformis]